MHSSSGKMFLLIIAVLTFCQNIQCELPLNNKNLTEDNSIHLQRSLNERSLNPLGFFSSPYGYSEDFLDADKIAGGNYAVKGQFPFMAVVHRLIGNGLIGQCGGTIISKRWVLTAGHCVDPYPRRFLVVFGIVSKDGIGYDFYQGSGISMLTTQGAVHPGYRQTTNDIALLHMPQDIPFSNVIQPISLAGRNYATETFTGRTSYVIGWGRDTASSSGTKALKYATLPIISNNECRRYWAADERNICTAAGLGQDACQGDSGGPLIVTNNGNPLQVGIVSYGDKNCPSNRPGVFTRVSEFNDWIQSVTKIRL